MGLPERLDHFMFIDDSFPKHTGDAVNREMIGCSITSSSRESADDPHALTPSTFTEYLPVILYFTLPGF